MDGVLVSLLCGIFFILGMWLGSDFQEGMWKREAISAGCAQYNSTTAEFEWRVK